jgi:hypothetical protein
MAELEFSKSMTSQELCAYLEEIGMEGDDLKKISGESPSEIVLAGWR